MMIAPISLVLATAHIINKLSSDSEIIVMNAAGVSPWPLVRPFLAAGLVVAALVATIGAVKFLCPRLDKIAAGYSQPPSKAPGRLSLSPSA